MKIKTLLVGLFIVGGWTLILGFVGAVCAFGLFWMGIFPYWPSSAYVTFTLGFIIGVLHFRAILRSP